MGIGADERGDGFQYVQSVERAIAVLELLADRGWAGVSEVARGIGIHKSTASRLLSTLERRSVVEQSSVTAKYRLGTALSRLGRAAATDPDLLRLSRPLLEELAASTRKTVNLAVLDGADVIYLEQVAEQQRVLGVNWLGRRTPLHATASGNVFLAFMSEAQRSDHLGQHLEQLTPQTVTDPRVLDERCTQIRAAGYGSTVEEFEAGLNAVAAPVRSHAGHVVAAVSVSGPSSQIPPDGIPALGELTTRVAEQVSRRLGYRAPGDG